MLTTPGKSNQLSNTVTPSICSTCFWSSKIASKCSNSHGISSRFAVSITALFSIDYGRRTRPTLIDISHIAVYLSRASRFARHTLVRLRRIAGLSLWVEFDEGLGDFGDFRADLPGNALQEVFDLVCIQAVDD